MVNGDLSGCIFYKKALRSSVARPVYLIRCVRYAVNDRTPTSLSAFAAFRTTINRDICRRTINKLRIFHIYKSSTKKYILIISLDKCCGKMYKRNVVHRMTQNSSVVVSSLGGENAYIPAL